MFIFFSSITDHGVWNDLSLPSGLKTLTRCYQHTLGDTALGLKILINISVVAEML